MPERAATNSAGFAAFSSSRVVDMGASVRWRSLASRDAEVFWDVAPRAIEASLQTHEPQLVCLGYWGQTSGIVCTHSASSPTRFVLTCCFWSAARSLTNPRTCRRRLDPCHAPTVLLSLMRTTQYGANSALLAEDGL